MKKFTFLLTVLALSFLANNTATAETYDKEYIITDFVKEVISEFCTNFTGYPEEGGQIDLSVFGVGYGKEYEVTGFIKGKAANGTANYYYSEELHTDVLEAIMEITSQDQTVRILMYKPFIEPTDTIIVENMAKAIKKLGMSNSLQLTGTDAECGSVTFTLSGCNGAYGEYPVSAIVGSLELSGDATWSNDSNNPSNDVLEAIVATDDKTTVLKVYAYTAAEKKEPVQIIITSATLTEEGDDLRITGTAANKKVVNLLLTGWATNGYGEYDIITLAGTIDGIDVANMSSKINVQQLDDDEVLIQGFVEDIDLNVYELTINGESPNKQDTIQVIATNLKNTVSYPPHLKLTATTKEGIAIELSLYEGANRGYDEYGYEGDYSDIENATYGKITLTLSKEVTAKYYQLGDIDVFEGVFTGSDNNIYLLKLSSAELPSGVENVTTTAIIEKIIDNGQLMILKNGVKYNVIGKIIK